jgi:hypothetical protein
MAAFLMARSRPVAVSPTLAAEPEGVVLRLLAEFQAVAATRPVVACPAAAVAAEVHRAEPVGLAVLWAPAVAMAEARPWLTILRVPPLR